MGERACLDEKKKELRRYPTFEISYFQEMKLPPEAISSLCMEDGDHRHSKYIQRNRYHYQSPSNIAMHVSIGMTFVWLIFSSLLPRVQ